MQHEIKTAHPLLDKKGHLIEAGFTKGLLMDYDRKAIKASGHRIKEWDYYLIANNDFAVALTIADNSYMGLDSISLLDLRPDAVRPRSKAGLKAGGSQAPGAGIGPWEHTNSPMSVFPFGKTGFPAKSSIGDVKHSGKHHSISFEKVGPARILKFQMDNFLDGKPISGEITLIEPPEIESMVICTPFAEDPKAFYYNQKINCMPAHGLVEFDGVKYEFEDGSFGVLDWGRGVWTYKNTWYWGSASGAVSGVPFGFNIGYGFGDTSAASENMLFYNHKAHKLSQVTFNIPMKPKHYITRGSCCGGQSGQCYETSDMVEDYMKPWTFTSDDGRFEMDFVPILDRASCTDVKLICSDQHQVFGRYSGTAILDDGTKIEIKDFLGFAEKVYNKW